MEKSKNITIYYSISRYYSFAITTFKLTNIDVPTKALDANMFGQTCLLTNDGTNVNCKDTTSQGPNFVKHVRKLCKTYFNVTMFNCSFFPTELCFEMCCLVIYLFIGLLRRTILRWPPLCTHLWNHAKTRYLDNSERYLTDAVVTQAFVCYSTYRSPHAEGMQPDSTSVYPPTRTSRDPRGASSAYSKPAQGQSRSCPLD